MSNPELRKTPPAEDLICANCRNVYVNPLVLKCGHPFCEACLKQHLHCREFKLAEAKKVICPTCHTGCLESDVALHKDLGERSLAYREGEREKQSTADAAYNSNKKQFDKKNDLCDLCEQRALDVYCNKCQKYLCTPCRAVHINIGQTECQETDSDQLDVLRQDIRKNLEKQYEELQLAMEKFKLMIAENEQSNERFVEECLAEMAVSEMHAIEANKEHYEDQRRTLMVLREEKLENLNLGRELLDKSLEKAADLGAGAGDQGEQKEAEEAAEEKATKAEELEKALLHQMHQIQKETTEHVKVGIKKKMHPLAFTIELQVPEVIKVVEPTELLSHPVLVKDERQSFRGHLKKLIGKLLKVEHKVEQPKIIQLRSVAGQLWALGADDFIRVLDQDGAVMETYQTGVQGSSDFCITGSGHVIVAATSGLHMVTFVTTTLDAGNYLSACYNDKSSIWAVKEEQEGDCVYIVKYLISTYRQQQIAKFKTNVNPGDYVIYCCTMSGRLFLSSVSKGCIYQIDPQFGCTQAVYGTKGSSDSGKLLGPSKIYGDDLACALIICDFGNNRFQLLKPGCQANKCFNDKEVWLMIRESVCVKQPQAATIDDAGFIWIAEKEGMLYKFSY